MIDNEMRTVLVAVRNLNDDKEKWFEALCKNYRGIDGTGDEVAKLVEAMRGLGRESRDIEAFEQVLKDLSGRAWETVGKLVEKDRELPALYTEAARPRTTASAPAAERTEDMLWVSEKLKFYIGQTYDRDWKTWLAGTLDTVLSDWKRRKPDDCAKWVDGWLQVPDAPVAVRPAAAAGDGVDLSWLTPKQREHILATYRQDPLTWLPAALGDKLPKLLQRDEAGRVAWVDKWLRLDTTSSTTATTAPQAPGRPQPETTTRPADSAASTRAPEPELNEEEQFISDALQKLFEEVPEAADWSDEELHELLVEVTQETAE